MRSIMFSMCALMGLTFIAIATGFFPAFTEDISRAVNVVHVVETNGSYSHNQEPSSYVSFYSLTPGNLEVESKRLSDEGFDCGRKTTLDFVSFTVKYACLSFKDTDAGWSKMEIPLLSVESDSTSIGSRITRALVDTKQSNRWSLAINAELISEFSFEVNSEELLPSGETSSVDGWHIIQFAGGKQSPKMFHSNLIWRKNVTRPSEGSPSTLLLKLRTDINRVTPKTARVLEKLPSWCALFGKSTSPYTFAFLTSLPADF